MPNFFDSIYNIIIMIKGEGVLLLILFGIIIHLGLWLLISYFLSKVLKNILQEKLVVV